MATALPQLTAPGRWLCYIGKPNSDTFTSGRFWKGRDLGTAAVEEVSLHVGQRRVTVGHIYGVHCVNLVDGMCFTVSVVIKSQNEFVADDVAAFHPRANIRAQIAQLMMPPVP